MNIRLAIWLGV